MGYEIDLLQKILALSQRSIDKQCVGDEKLDVTDLTAVSLTVPARATSAIITVEASTSAATTAKVVRFRESGDTATDSIGTPLGDLDTYECLGPEALANFSIIGIEAGKTHTLNINYYM